MSWITLPDVSTHLRPGSKAGLGGLTFAEAPLSAISRFNWSPESTKARRLFEAPRQDDSSFRADLEQSTTKNRRNCVMTKSTPTLSLTQSGLLAVLLQRQRYKSIPVGPASRTPQAHARRPLEYRHLAVPCAHGTNACRRCRQALGGNPPAPHLNLSPS